MTSAIIQVPDIGTKDAVDIIEINVKPGDRFSKDDTLLVLESDKATMEIPAPYDGVVGELKVKVGDSVKTGDPILALAGEAPSAEPATAPAPAVPSSPVPVAVTTAPTPAPAAAPMPPPVSTSPAAALSSPATATTQPVPPEGLATPVSSDPVHAGPAVRRLARELGVDLGPVKGSGPKGRILKEDVHAWVKSRLASPATAVAPAVAPAGSGLPELPEIDFAAFGPIETMELSRINRLSAANLHRAWLHIPHVTQFDEADVTDLEAFRKAEAAPLKDQGVRLTMLAFLVKASVRALQAFPRFNSSLNREATALTLKKYYHVGIAVDTPNGLVVPVIRDADRKSVVEIAGDMQTLSAKARDKKLTPADMQGACFSISSLGGIGGTAFTPIVNWPEVAILGVSKMQTRPQWDGKAFVPRLMLPLSLSYDHRVIDGAEAARFTTFLSAQLADIRRLLL
jgi:pyruvate dehydrogenase E2 component (dihydrolipoamide acetyltransferase)